MEPKLLDKESVRHQLVDLISSIPSWLPSSFNRMKMWELIETRVSNAAKSTRTFSEWWNIISNKLQLSSAAYYSDSRSKIPNLLESMPKELRAETWRQLRNETVMLIALSRDRWEEKKKTKKVEVDANV